MNCRDRLRAAAFSLCLGVFPGGSAVAACADLLSVGLSPPAPPSTIQAGLRAALSDLSPSLADGQIGAYTRSALSRLCSMVPLPAGEDEVAGTLVNAAEYGQLSAALPGWPGIVRSEAVSARLLPGSDGRPNPLALRLAGPAVLSAQALASDAGAAGCTGEPPQGLGEVAEAGRSALIAAAPVLREDMLLCAAFGGPRMLPAALESLGRIEAALPGALTQLAAADFAFWLAEDRETRPLRLVGSDAAVVALLAEYRGENRAAAPRDYSAIFRQLPRSCAPIETPRSTDYASFPPESLAQTLAPVDVPGLLAPLDGQRFATSDDLLAAIQAALAGQVGQCALDQIRQAVESPDDLGLTFALNADATNNLALDPSFADSVPAVEPLIGLSARSRPALLAGVRAAIAKAAETRLAAQVELAAATLAAAAEPENLPFDTRPADVPEFEEVPLPPTFGVTDNTISAVQAVVTDPDLLGAITGADFLPASNTEVLKGDVRRLLAPIAAGKVDAIVTRDLARIQATVEQSWSLTGDLSAAIAAAPGVGAAESRDVGPEVATAMEVLAGLEYPNGRLFLRALETVSPPPSAALAADAARASLTMAPDADRLRSFRELAEPDCGCVSARWDFTETYAFYPYWLAPPSEESERQGAGGLEVSADASGEQAPPLRQVDFGKINSLAFYGPEFRREEKPQPGSAASVQLFHGDQWIHGRRDFIEAAHRHRASADVAFNVSGWSGWTDAEIEAVAARMAELTAPHDRFDDWSTTELARGIPTIFDRPQADGITIVADCYQGTAISDDPDCLIEGGVLPVGRLVTLVKAVSELVAPRGQIVNLALDVPLVGGPAREPLFDEIKDLIISPDDTDPALAYLLVFLERPTSDAKKLLRGRLEHGDYRGVDRTDVLRRILPVLPPSGHRLVRDAVSGSPASAAFGVEYGQFVDDLVYFQDNFAGLAFWPAPDPLGEETPEIERRLAIEWFYDPLPVVLDPVQARADEICTFVCPNRAWFAGTAWLVALATGALVARSFYSGLADKIAFRLGFAWIGIIALFGIIATMSLCDHAAFWPDVAAIALGLALALVLALSAYQRAQNGPMP